MRSTGGGRGSEGCLQRDHVWRIRHHVGALREEKVPDDYINPAELTSIQRTMLREAFKAIDRVQKGLALRYDIRVP